ncbi:hypothetical protein Nepgr_015759 [Nepenthes gracilis]|uniref:Uncharacterized protein n=1 Tax=Nepenthes gracilis TaxID=150966 RepID=A0AAD3XQZ8_NEPGR|nr:hypothetical protein Nepgr_015759 [Nepenthes gracilis]
MMIRIAYELVKAPEKGPLCMENLPEDEPVASYLHFGQSNGLDQISHLLTMATRELFTELDKMSSPCHQFRSRRCYARSIINLANYIMVLSCNRMLKNVRPTVIHHFPVS